MEKEDPARPAAHPNEGRHFITPSGLFSARSTSTKRRDDVLLDDSRESQVRELGEGIKEIELHGNYFGQFS